MFGTEPRKNRSMPSVLLNTVTAFGEHQAVELVDWNIPAKLEYSVSRFGSLTFPAGSGVGPSRLGMSSPRERTFPAGALVARPICAESESQRSARLTTWRRSGGRPLETLP